jgi:hypothetical protein
MRRKNVWIAGLATPVMIAMLLAERPKLAAAAGVDCPVSSCRRAKARSTVRTGCNPPLNNRSKCCRSRLESWIRSALPLPMP